MTEKEMKEGWQKIIILTDFIKREIAPKILSTAPPSPKILELRKKAVDFFQNEIFVSICSQCKGNCCGPRVPPMDLLEIVYLCIVNKNFFFPEPDWRFLKSEYHINSYCICLGSNGCLLKDNRPVICLRHICDKHMAKIVGVWNPSLIFLNELGDEFWAWREKVKFGELIRLYDAFHLYSPIEYLKGKLQKIVKKSSP